MECIRDPSYEYKRKREGERRREREKSVGALCSKCSTQGVAREREEKRSDQTRL